MTGHTSSSDAPLAAFDSDIRLTLPARAENVAVVRHVLGVLTDALAFPVALTEDIRLAVSEACTNVVRHAYGDGEGTIDVLVHSGDGAVEITVADTGQGLPSQDTAGPGLGLPLIAALADRFRVERSESAGSRLIMSFGRASARPVLGLVA